MGRFKLNTYGLSENVISQLVSHTPGYYFLVKEKSFDKGIELKSHLEAGVTDDLQRDLLKKIGTPDIDSFGFQPTSTFDEAKKQYAAYKKYMKDK